MNVYNYCNKINLCAGTVVITLIISKENSILLICVKFAHIKMKEH